eukprot:5600952-Prymnesium_polylepis.1
MEGAAKRQRVQLCTPRLLVLPTSCLRCVGLTVVWWIRRPAIGGAPSKRQDVLRARYARAATRRAYGTAVRCAPLTSCQVLQTGL